MCSRLYFLLLALISLVCACNSLPVIVTEKCGNTICPNNGIGIYCFDTCENGIPTQGCCPIGHLCINTCNRCGGGSICSPNERCQFCSSDPASSKCCPIGALCTISNCTMTAISKLSPMKKTPTLEPVALSTQSSPSTHPTTTKTPKPTTPSTFPTAKTTKPTTQSCPSSIRPTKTSKPTNLRTPNTHPTKHPATVARSSASGSSNLRA